VPQDWLLLLTTEQTAEVLNVSPRTIFALGKDGVLPRVQIGRAVRFRRADVEAFARRGTPTTS